MTIKQRSAPPTVRTSVYSIRARPENRTPRQEYIEIGFDTSGAMENYRLAHVTVIQARGVYFRAELWLRDQNNPAELNQDGPPGMEVKHVPAPPVAPIPPGPPAAFFPPHEVIPEGQVAAPVAPEAQAQAHQPAQGGSRLLEIHHPQFPDDGGAPGH